MNIAQVSLSIAFFSITFAFGVTVEPERELVGLYYPVYTGNWATGYCSTTVNVNAQGKATDLACCNAYFPNQSSGYCYSLMANPPTASPISSSGLTVWYADYSSAYSVATCINAAPLPSGRPFYNDMLTCCKKEYGSQLSGACLQALPNPPTMAPTKVPTSSPTNKPTTMKPTNAPTKKPTRSPTKAPTSAPSKKPTSSPTKKPTGSPTTSPTKKPTSSPTKKPTSTPTVSPSKKPTSSPTLKPTSSPTKAPTNSPTKAPTNSPTKKPTSSPTLKPTSTPTKAPTSVPTKKPTNAPTNKPTRSPTNQPTSSPTKSKLDVWYPNYSATWETGTCINNAPLPNGRITYSDMLTCCLNAYAGQTSGACLQSLPNPPTAAPVKTTGTLFFPVWSTWEAGYCDNDPTQITSGNSYFYATQQECCDTWFKNQQSEACINH